jgi:hypothetical protein
MAVLAAPGRGWEGPMHYLWGKIEQNGVGPALINERYMKKNTLILKPRTKLSLGDLILAVSSCTRNTKETVATVADLLDSGKVRLQSNGRFLRAKVC